LRELLERDKKYVWHPYTQEKTAKEVLPIVSGEGAVLRTADGTEVIDAIASWWTNIHGHSHPYIAQKVYEQLTTLEHVIFSGFTHPPAVELAERLLKKLPSKFTKLFYSDNGSTAVEIAVKMAIQSFHNKGIDRTRIIAFENGFHGETFGAMSVSADLGLNNAYSKQLFDVDRIPLPIEGQEQAALDAMQALLDDGDICCFLFEPLLQGAGGMVTYSAEILDQLIEMCQKAGVLCIADEVMTGFYRTGKMWAIDHLKNQPDLVAMSKGITGGTLPLAATACTEEIYKAFWSDDKQKTFFHGHSYTGNPVGCAAGLASLDLVEADGFVEKIAHINAKHQAFAESIKDHSTVKNWRICGTVIAIEFETGESTGYFNNLRDQLYYFFLENGVLLRPLGNVIYIMPPYCMTDAQLDKVYGLIAESLSKFG